MKHLIINKDLENLIFNLSSKEFDLLESDIVKNGVLDPIKVFSYENQNVILDGHHRYKISQKHNLPYTTQDLQFNNILDAKIWMLHNQQGRRNLTNYQRADLAATYKKLLEVKGRENLKKSGEHFGVGHKKGSLNSVNPISDIKPVDSQKEAAATYKKLLEVKGRENMSIAGTKNNPSGSKGSTDLLNLISDIKPIDSRKEAAAMFEKCIEDDEYLSKLYDGISGSNSKQQKERQYAFKINN